MWERKRKTEREKEIWYKWEREIESGGQKKVKQFFLSESIERKRVNGVRKKERKRYWTKF